MKEENSKISSQEYGNVSMFTEIFDHMLLQVEQGGNPVPIVASSGQVHSGVNEGRTSGDDRKTDTKLGEGALISVGESMMP